jgi:hypothetical protein
METRIIALFLMLALCNAPLRVQSQWSANPAVNNAICSLPGEQAIPKIATCPNGDTYIGYFSNESGNYNVRLQRLDASGNILWAPNGILISGHPQETWLTDWDMTCDAANCAILVFNDIRTGNTNVVAYRISPSGNFEWGANGIMLSNTMAFNAAPKVAATPAGNIIVAWSADDVSIMQRLSPSGAPQWGPAGITITSANRTTWPQLLPVGNDDVILKYFNDSGLPNAPTRHVFAQRYNPSGTAVWAAPAAISTAGGISAWTQVFPFINDGNDGFYIAWHDDRDNNQRASAFVQHVSSSGTVLFPANGVEASTMATMNHYYPVLALPPGSPDVFVFWNEMNALQSQWGIFGQKIDPSGALQWGPSGMTFIPVSTTNVYPYAASHSTVDMIVVYEQYTNSIEGMIKAMRIAPDGSFVWTPAQKDICTVPSQKVHPEVNQFNNNQWIVTWEDNRNGNADIYAQNIQLDGSLGPVSMGSIQGQVVITGEPADVTQATVSAGGYSAHPGVNGIYTLHVPEGIYIVTATHPYTNSQTIDNISVTGGSPTTGVNFALTVNRADMVVSATDNFGTPLNNVEVVIEGPEGPYTGMILHNSIIFPHVPYGSYHGTATYGGIYTTQSDTTINALNHHLRFVFILTGISAEQKILSLQVYPNPAGPESHLFFIAPRGGKYSVELFDGFGRVVQATPFDLEAGSCRIGIRQLSGNKSLLNGIYHLRLSGPGGVYGSFKTIYQRE